MADVQNFHLQAKHTKTRHEPRNFIKTEATCVTIYTGCPRRNVPDFGRVFLRSNYTNITQNTYIPITEILAREKCGLLWCLRSILCP